MNFSKKNHEHKQRNILFVSKNFNFKSSKVSTVFLLCSLLLFVFTSCQESERYFEVDEKARTEMITHIIPLKDAVDSYKDYGKNRVKILKDTLKIKYGKDFNDTRIVSIDIETMKQYILYVEEKSKELEVEPKGLQFYFGVYSEKDEKAGKKKNHQTFFIAPSTSNSDFQKGYTFETKDGKKQIIYLKDVLKNEKYTPSQGQKVEKASFFSQIQGEDEGLILNRNGLSPPN